MSTVYVRVNGAEGVSKLLVDARMAPEEVRSLCYSAADVPESDKDVVIKITKADGTILPVSASLPPNDASEPYALTVKSCKPLSSFLYFKSSDSFTVKSNSLTVKQGLIDTKLTEITNALSGLKDLTTLKDQMLNLQRRLEVGLPYLPLPDPASHANDISSATPTRTPT